MMMPAKTSLKKSMSGLSMIELMIAMVIGLLLTAAVLHAFVGMKRTYTFTEEFSRIQQNGRFAVDLIGRDARMAGHLGCFSKGFNPAEMATQVENELNDTGDHQWSLNNLLDGVDNDDGDDSNFANVVPGTDVLIIKFMSSDMHSLVAPYSDSAQMFADSSFNADCPGGGSDCHEGEILMVTDCTQATMFQATNIANVGGGAGVNITHSAAGYSPGNSSPPTFSKTYGAGAAIARLESFAYYIRENPAGEPSLYRSRLKTNGGGTASSMVPEELVEGVEDMQVLYGEDTDGDGVPEYYTTADDVASMDDVVSLDVSLMLRSLNNGMIDGGAVAATTLAGTGLAPPADRRIRRVFNTRIALRNRLD